MRIALLMHLGSPWSRAIAEGLADEGHEVHLVDFERHSSREQYLFAQDPFQAAEIARLREKVKSLHLLPASVSSLRYLLAAGRLRKLLRAQGAEVSLALYGGGYAMMAALGGRPYAVYVVGSDVMLARGWKRPLIAALLTRAGKVFVNGRHLWEKTMELAPRARAFPHLIGIPTDRFELSAKASPPIRILCTRGFLPVYNNSYLIEGLAQLPDDLPAWDVTFVSSGSLLPEVKALADRLLSCEKRKRVHFLGGVTIEDLALELERAHLYVSLSSSDGTSTALLEALASGLYPILSDIPPNREWIEGEHGRLVPLGRPKELADALAAAIRMEDRETSARHNRAAVLEKADSKANLRALAAELESMLAEKRKGKP